MKGQCSDGLPCALEPEVLQGGEERDGEMEKEIQRGEGEHMFK